MSMNATGQMALPGQGSTGGLLIGGDTNLYWNASNQLRTDDLIITVGLRSTANASYGLRTEQVAGNVAYGNVLLSTDANYAFQITGQGTHQWGAGGASPVDTVLYRAAADVLGTDDEFLINRPVIAGHYAPILTWGARRFWRNSSGSSAESSFAQWSVANTRWEAANTSTIIGPGVIETSYANPTWKFRTAGIASFTQGDPLTFVDALVIASTGAVGFGLTPTAGRLQLLADTTAAGGIYFGGDTNLYRGAANVLQTSGNFSMGSAATRDALLTNQGWDIRYRTAAQATSVLYGVRIDSEPNYRFYFDANGKHQWGDGTATPDTTLYRSAADQLQTDDKFVVNHPAGYGIIVLTPSGYTSLTARVQADTNDRVSIEPAASRINFGSGSATVDTNLYRLQADILKTDDALQVALALTTLNGQITATRSSTGVGAFAAYVTGDANPRFKITPTSAGAQLEWGDGTAVPDVIMTRAAADWLDIQDRFSSSRALATDAAFLTRVAGVNQWYIRADGYMTWYDAAGVPDTTLYRGAADVLRTDDQFQSVRTNATDSAFLAQATGLGGFGTFLVRADGYLEWGSGAAARDTSIYRTVQHTLAGLETSAPIRIIRVGVSNQHVQLTPGDASANYIDSWTSEANKKPLIFRTLHGSEGTPAGGQGFAWWVGPSATPTAVMSLSDTGNLNVQGASAGYSIAGVALYSKHLSDQANIAMLNEAEVIVGGWTYTTLATTFRSSVQFREAGGAGSPRMDIVVGTVASPAYLAWYNAAGLRKTYLGFGTDTTTDFQAENGARIGFNQGAATLAAEQNAVSFSGSGLQTFSANVVNQRMIQFNPPAAYAGDVAGRTITTAATVNIAGAPTAGTNMAITNLYSLWVSAGTTRVDGLLSLANGTNTAATGLQFGADVALYRNTTDVLMTDDRFIIQAASAGANAFTIRVAGQNALNVAGSGQLQWSDCIGGSLDTFLQREAAARLLANPDLRVSRWFAVGSTAGSL
ncbi:MAG TPA: hypothetical protein VNS88_01840, partial [Nitrospiraceae bacterium]|nr:hypothetical protein [Nitrospiraceae bacterium]